MGHGRPKPLTVGEAKAAIIAWGENLDRALGRGIAHHPWATLGGAVAVGIVLAQFGSRKRRRDRRRCR